MYSTTILHSRLCGRSEGLMVTVVSSASIMHDCDRHGEVVRGSMCDANVSRYAWDGVCVLRGCMGW